MNLVIDEIVDKLYEEDIHPVTGEYAPNLAQVAHTVEVLTDLLESGKLVISELPELVDQLRDRYTDQELRNLSLSHHSDWGTGSNSEFM